VDELTLLWLLAGIAIVSIPVVGVYFRVLSTLFHEIGHGLMALIMGGGVRKIELSASTAGLATTTSRNWFSRVMILLAGYPFASMMAALSALILSSYGTSKLLLFIGLIAIISMVIWVRNIFGLIWIAAFSGITIFAYINADSKFSFLYAMFIVVILSIESVRSAVVILTLSFKSKKDAGDARDLAMITKIPTLFWGFLFFLQSLFFFIVAMYLFWQMPE